MTVSQDFDLNLVRVFDAVMQNGSVAAAGRQLGVTGSAVSHALARLRRVLGDELFVPSETGMVPTARARDLHPDLSGALAQIGQALARRPFDPRQSSRVFTIAVGEYAASVVLPRLLNRLAGRAPRLGFSMAPFDATRLQRQLEDGRILLAIGQFGVMREGLQRATVLSDEDAIACRPGHPLSVGPLTWARALTFPQVVVQMGHQPRDGGDDAPRGPGRRERAGAAPARIVVPDYAAVPALLENTDLIAVGPRRLAAKALGRLAILKPSGPAPGYRVELAWHGRAAGDAGLNWLVGEILDEFALEQQEDCNARLKQR